MILLRAIKILKKIAPGIVCLMLISCGNKIMDDLLIITESPTNLHQNPSSDPVISGRLIPGARISKLNPDRPSSRKVLTAGFHSACSPWISYDGKTMLFTAQQDEGDTWQIWEMDLERMETRQITYLDGNCLDPVCLPSGRIIFSRHVTNDTVRSSYALFSCNPDGTEILPVTFHPNANYATSVLKDGRLLTLSRPLYPPEQDPFMMVLRPDGTKAGLFYKGNGRMVITGRASETSDGRIYFIETEEEKSNSGDVISIRYNRPLHSRINHTEKSDGSFTSVLPLRSGRLLVSFRRTVDETYGICELDMLTGMPGQVIYMDPEYDIVDMVMAGSYERPKKLPSEVDMKVKTGLLLCQDINIAGSSRPDKSPGITKASLIEILGIDSTYGVVPVAEDGSFYLKILADKPFRIRTLDKKGVPVSGPGAWLWLRPNERRGCVGCHEDPERVPFNRVPLAVKNQPVIIPVHVTKVIEKAVELE